MTAQNKLWQCLSGSIGEGLGAILRVVLVSRWLELVSLLAKLVDRRLFPAFNPGSSDSYRDVFQATLC